jgi:hypothetical protein
VRRSHAEAARLGPADLVLLRAVAGDGALDYVLVLGVFHFINRIADLLHVDPEALPERLRRFESIRRLGVHVASRILARGDMENRPYAVGWDDARSRIAPLLGRHGTDALRALAPRPKLVEALQLALEERARSGVDRATLQRIDRTVEAALPVAAADVEGFHPRPPDPVEAFAFVGTRYAYRATADMIDALRRAGYDDLGILDLAIAVADANQWARTHRLLGLPPDLFYV